MAFWPVWGCTVVDKMLSVSLASVLALVTGLASVRAVAAVVALARIWAGAIRASMALGLLLCVLACPGRAVASDRHSPWLSVHMTYSETLECDWQQDHGPDAVPPAYALRWARVVAAPASHVADLQYLAWYAVHETLAMRPVQVQVWAHVWSGSVYVARCLLSGVLL